MAELPGAAKVIGSATLRTDRGPLSLSYDAALEFLFPRVTTIKFGLETTRALLAEVGDPHTVFPIVHIGGTNGKGSVSTLVAAALRRTGLAGRPVHLAAPGLVPGAHAWWTGCRSARRRWRCGPSG